MTVPDVPKFVEKVPVEKVPSYYDIKEYGSLFTLEQMEYHDKLSSF